MSMRRSDSTGVPIWIAEKWIPVVAGTGSRFTKALQCRIVGGSSAMHFAVFEKSKISLS
jgi:hypothetical protein